MEKIRIEKQGRILIPKKIREKLDMRSGKEMVIRVGTNEVVLKILRSPEDFSSKLKGCVKQSRVKPLEVKRIWEM